MNIKSPGMWPTTIMPHSVDTWEDLFRLRQRSYTGFLSIEEKKGLLTLNPDYSTPKGQEMMRILLFRVLEEYGEATESHDLNHVREELIDSFNYLLEVALLGRNIPEAHFSLALALSNAWEDCMHIMESPREGVHPDAHELGTITQEIVRLGDLFRNRAWMEHAQDLYWAGHSSLIEAVALVSKRIFFWFPDWPTFYSFFVAKDNVLQFRLRSRY